MLPKLVCASELPRDLVKYTDFQDPLLNLITSGNLNVDQLSQGLLCNQSGIHWRIRFDVGGLEVLFQWPVKYITL